MTDLATIHNQVDTKQTIKQKIQKMEKTRSKCFLQHSKTNKTDFFSLNLGLPAVYHIKHQKNY